MFLMKIFLVKNLIIVSIILLNNKKTYTQVARQNLAFRFHVIELLRIYIYV